MAIDIYNGANKDRHNVWVKNTVDTFTFNVFTNTRSGKCGWR